MPETEDLALLIAAAQEAGQIATRHFGAGPQVWDKGSGQGPVTEADLEIDRMLQDRLRSARPDYGWLSEETAADPARLRAERMFIVDPIDGTRAFIDGQKGFAHALAVVEAGAPVAAVVFLPLMGLIYTASRGGGAFCNGAPMQVRQGVEGTPPAVLAARPVLEPRHWPGGLPEVTRHFRPSLAWRLALVAEGQFDAMLAMRATWHWDIAAGALLVTEAGGAITDAGGEALRFDTECPSSEGVVAAAPGLQAALLARRLGGSAAR